MGIEPTYPSAKYGYIIPKSRENISPVSMFKEKPTEEVAKTYITQEHFGMEVCLHFALAMYWKEHTN